MRGSVESYPRAAVERAMKVQEVILRAMAKKISWWQAAEIIGISDRQMRRWRERYEEHGYDGLIDRRRGRPSEKRWIPTFQQLRLRRRDESTPTGHLHLLTTAFSPDCYRHSKRTSYSCVCESFSCIRPRCVSPHLLRSVRIGRKVLP